jgi:hypothetical protein
VVHHAGGVPGYSAFMARFVEDDLTIIILSNRGLFDAAVKLGRPIANLLLNLPEPLAPAIPMVVEERALARMAGSYVNMFDEPLNFTIDGRRLRAAGKLTADLIPFAPATFRAANDPDIHVSFEDETETGFSRATVIVPYYWYVVYRKPGV